MPTMMKPLGHEVIVYGAESHEHQGEHVGCYVDVDPPAFTAADWSWFNLHRFTTTTSSTS